MQHNDVLGERHDLEQSKECRDRSSDPGGKHSGGAKASWAHDRIDVAGS